MQTNTRNKLCILLGAVLIVEFDISRKEGPELPLLHTLGVYISLLLKELPSAVKVTYRGWGSCTSDDSLSIILLSPTTRTGSRGHSRMELAILIRLSNLFLFCVDMGMVEFV